MKVGELKKELAKYSDDLNIEIRGVYSSSGGIENVSFDKEENLVVFISDIMSG